MRDSTGDEGDYAGTMAKYGTPGPARQAAPDARCIVRVQVLERVYRAVLALPFNLPQGLCDAIEAMYQSVRLDELQVPDSGGPREAERLNGIIARLTGGEPWHLERDCPALRAELGRAGTPDVWEQAAKIADEHAALYRQRTADGSEYSDIEAHACEQLAVSLRAAAQDAERPPQETTER